MERRFVPATSRPSGRAPNVNARRSAARSSARPRIPSAYLDLGLGGALLLDLALRGRLALVDGQVAVVGRAPVGDTLLDDALTAVAGTAKPHPPEYWAVIDEAALREA